MATPNQLPRISGVIDPGNGFYRVSVMMTQELASKYPSKPWTTKLSELNLHGPDALKYKDYVLVEIVPTRDPSELVWVFQKLEGPVWETRSSGAESLIPAKFRGLVDTLRTEQEVYPDADPDPIAGSVTQSIVEQQKDSGKAVRVTTTETLGGNGPLEGFGLGDGELRTTINESLIVTGEQVEANTPTLKVVADPLGNGFSVKRTVEQEVFAAGGFSSSIEDTIPSKFRGNFPETTEEVTVVGEAKPPLLAAGELSKSERQLTEFTKRVSSTYRDPSSLPATLNEVLVDSDGILIDRTQTLASGDQTISPSSLITGSVEAIGKGLTIKTEDVKAEVFPAAAYTASKPDVTPQEFRAEVPETTTEVTIAGDAAIPELDSSSISKSEQQVTKFVKRVRASYRDASSLPATLEEEAVDRDGVSIKRTKTLSSGEQHVIPSAKVTGEVIALGGGKFLKVEEEKLDAFDDRAESHEQAVNIPAKFVDKDETISEIVESSSPTLPELNDGGEGVIAASTQRIDMFRANVRTTTRTLASGDLKGSQLFLIFGGGKASVSEGLVDDGAEAQEGFDVLSSTVSPIGGGRAIQETVRADGEFATLSGQRYDADYGFDIPFSERIVNAGEAVVNADIEPLDKWRSKVKEVDYDAYRNQLLEVHVILPGEESVQLPDTLLSVDVLVSRSQGVGSGTGNGSSFSVLSSSSVAVSADLSYEIEEGYSGPVPAETHIFFLRQDDSTAETIMSKCNAQPYPQYKPTQKRLVMAGHGASRNFQFSSSDSGSSGSEFSDMRAFTNVATIPSTLNAVVVPNVTYHDFTAETGIYDDVKQSILDAWTAKIEALKELVENAPDGTDEFVLGYLSTYLNGLENSIEIANNLNIADFTIALSPESIQATTPTSVAPGRYITRSSAQIYGFGLVKVTTIVAIIE